MPIWNPIPPKNPWTPVLAAWYEPGFTTTDGKTFAAARLLTASEVHNPWGMRSYFAGLLLDEAPTAPFVAPVVGQYYSSLLPEHVRGPMSIILVQTPERLALWHWFPRGRPWEDI